MPITGVAAALPGGQDLYKGLATKTKNEEEFSLSAKSSAPTNKAADVKKTFWDQLTNQVTKTSSDNPPVAQTKTYEERLSDIRRKGDLLLHHPLPGMVKDYIKDVKDLLTDVRDNAYSSKQEDGVFKKLDLADEKLVKLTDDLLAEQKPEIDLVASLGELQGLLVDIFV